MRERLCVCVREREEIRVCERLNTRDIERSERESKWERKRENISVQEESMVERNSVWERVFDRGKYHR